MGDALTFAEQSCRSGPRLEFGDAYAIDCERISQKFSHEDFRATARHVYGRRLGRDIARIMRVRVDTPERYVSCSKAPRAKPPRRRPRAKARGGAD